MDKIKNLLGSSGGKDNTDPATGDFTNKYQVSGEGSHFGTAGPGLTGTAVDRDPTTHMPGAYEADDGATTASVASGVPGKAQAPDPVVDTGADTPAPAVSETKGQNLPPQESALGSGREEPSQETLLGRGTGAPPQEPLLGRGDEVTPQEPVVDHVKDVLPAESALGPKEEALPLETAPAQSGETAPVEPSTIGTAVTSGEAAPVEPQISGGLGKSEPGQQDRLYLERDVALGAGTGAGVGAVGGAIASDGHDSIQADPLGADTGRSFPLAGSSETAPAQNFSPGQIGTYPAGGVAPGGSAEPGPQPDQLETGPIVGSKTETDPTTAAPGTGPTPTETGQITGSGPVPTAGGTPRDTLKTDEKPKEDAALAAGGAGVLGVGAYEATRGSGDNVTSSTTGPAPNTAGPHKSDLLNKLDPRVDSDLSKQRSKTEEPVQEPTTATKPGSSTATTTTEPEHHYKRDAAVVGAGGAGAGALYEADKDRDTKPEPTTTSTTADPALGTTRDTTVPSTAGTGGAAEFEPAKTQDPLAPTTGATTAEPDHHYGRDAGIVGAGGLVGAAGYEAEKGRQPTDPTEPAPVDITTVDGSNVQPLQSSTATTGPRAPVAQQPPPTASKDVSTISQTDPATRPEDRIDPAEDHTKRDVLLAGATGAAGGAIAGNELSDKDAKKLEKEHEKEIKQQEKQEVKEQKAHEKAVAKEQKAVEKQEAKEQKEQEKVAKKEQKEEKKDEKKHGGILGIFKRDKSDKELMEENEERKAALEKDRHGDEETAAGAGAIGLASDKAAAGQTSTGGERAITGSSEGLQGRPEDEETAAGAGATGLASGGNDRGIIGPDDGSTSKAALKDSAISSGSGIAGPAGTAKPGFEDNTATHDRSALGGAAVGAAGGAAVADTGLHDDKTTPAVADTTQTTTTQGMPSVSREKQSAILGESTGNTSAATADPITRQEQPSTTSSTAYGTAPATTKQQDPLVSQQSQEPLSQAPPNTKTIDSTAGATTADTAADTGKSGSGIGPLTTHDAYGADDPGRNKLHKEPPQKVLEQRDLGGSS